MKRSEITFGLLRLPVDFITTVMAWYVALFLRLHPALLAAWQPVAESAPPQGAFAMLAGVSAALLLPLLALQGLYSFRYLGRGREISGIIFAIAFWLLFITAYFFFAREFFFSRLVLVYEFFIAVVCVSSGRLMIRGLYMVWLRTGHDQRRIALLGCPAATAQLAAAVQRDPRFVIAARQQVPLLSGEPLTAYLTALIAADRIEEIALADQSSTPALLREILAYCRNHHIDFHFVPHLADASPKNIDIATFSGIPLITLRPSALTGWGRVSKRVFDIVVGTLALIGTVPIWMITAVAIRLESVGPVFFGRYPGGGKVLRVGRHGRLFWFIKFRSMVVNDHFSRYAQQSHREGPIVKITNDPRVTRVGKFIRKTSIDELPNLISVLLGDMSLVGPRPHLPEEVAHYTPEQRRVLEIKPGITGLPQVSGRSDLDFSREVELDIWYIENWSLWLDIKILFQTIGVVVRPRHRE